MVYSKQGNGIASMDAGHYQQNCSWRKRVQCCSSTVAACVTISFSQSEPQHNSKESLEGHIWDKSLALEHSSRQLYGSPLAPRKRFRVNCFSPRRYLKGQHMGGCLCPLRWFHRDSSSDLTPAYQPPVLVDPEKMKVHYPYSVDYFQYAPSGESDLLQHLCADRGGQGNFG